MKMEKIPVYYRAFFLPLSFIPKAGRSQGLVPVHFPFDWLSLVAIRGAGAGPGAESVGKLCRPRLGTVEGMPVPPGMCFWICVLLTFYSPSPHTSCLIFLFTEQCFSTLEPWDLSSSQTAHILGHELPSE